TGMAQVEQHAHALHLGYQLAAIRSQAPVLAVGTASSGGILLVEGNECLANSKVVEQLDHGWVAFEAACSLEVQNDAEAAGAARQFDVRDAAHQQHAVLAFAQLPPRPRAKREGLADIVVVAGEGDGN